jgi:predicted amidohydrolase
MTAQITLAQINFLKGDPLRHIERIRDTITRYKSSDLIVFPELILHGHPSLEAPEGMLYRKMKKFYAAIHDESADLYRYVKEAGARVILGELKGKPGSFSNVATYIDRDSIQHYVKTHVHWTEHFTPGRELKPFQTPLGPVGITICFDAAFSEAWRVLALKGAKIIVNISAVPRTFSAEYMWRRCAGAAICNQVFVVYANRPGGYFGGCSAIFGPKGDVIASVKEDETVLQARIDLDEVDRWREEEQIYQNRRPLLYRDISRSHSVGADHAQAPITHPVTDIAGDRLKPIILHEDRGIKKEA